MSRGLLPLTLTSRWGNESITVNALVISSLPVHVSPVGDHFAVGAHLQELRLTDLDFLKNNPFQIILSAPVYGLVLCDGVRKGELFV